MSNFIAPTRYPDEAGEIQPATWLDDYFGPHEYGVRFPDGKVFHEKEIESKKPIYHFAVFDALVATKT